MYNLTRSGDGFKTVAPHRWEVELTEMSHMCLCDDQMVMDQMVCFTCDVFTV